MSTVEADGVYLVDGARTPILKARARRGPFSSADLAVQAGRSLLLRQPFAASEIDEAILGCVMPSEREANIGRIAALRLGLGEQTPAWTVQRNCASGMQAVDCALNRIQLGHSDLVLAGGVEAMSRAPVLSSSDYVDWMARVMAARSGLAKLKAIAGFRPRFLAPVFALEHGLNDPVVNLGMGQTAEKIAARFGIDRLAMDQFAVESHRRAAAAVESGVLADEVVPLIDGDGAIYAADDGIRADSSVDKLAKLKPVFERPFGRVTAGNSSQISDGAAWLLIASGRAVEQHGLKPLARLHAVEWAGLDPSEMGLGPVHATARLLESTGRDLASIDYWEINEAFAGQVLACLEAFRSEAYCREELGRSAALGEIDPARLNVDGGAVAIGHPVGMSGARIVLHIANVLRQRDAQWGVATLCIGGGQGGAALVERMPS